jgi:hypothetical protein
MSLIWEIWEVGKRSSPSELATLRDRLKGCFCSVASKEGRKEGRKEWKMCEWKDCSLTDLL